MRKILVISTLFFLSAVSYAHHDSNSLQIDPFTTLKLEFLSEMESHSIAHYHHKQDFLLEKHYYRVSTKYYKLCVQAEDMEQTECSYFAKDFVLDEWTISETERIGCRKRHCFVD